VQVVYRRIAAAVTTEVPAEVFTVKAIDTERKNLYVVSTQSLIESIRALLLR